MNLYLPLIQALHIVTEQIYDEVPAEYDDGNQIYDEFPSEYEEESGVTSLNSGKFTIQ